MTLENKVEEATAAETPPAEAPKEDSEEQKAYKVCDREMKAFLRKLNSSYCGGDAMREAWSAIAIYPFAKGEPKFTYTEARELYEHFMELNSAKFVMFMHGLAREKVVTILKPLTETPEAKEIVEETTPTTETEKT
jgi:hypothetical protein